MTLDGSTPPGNAEEIRKWFPNTFHLIIDGVTHSDPLFLLSPRIKENKRIKFGENFKHI